MYVFICIFFLFFFLSIYIIFAFLTLLFAGKRKDNHCKLKCKY